MPWAPSPVAYNALHQQQRAVETFQSALDIWRELGDKNGEGTTLAHIGDVYREWGFPDQAIRFYRDALKSIRAHPIRQR